MELIYKLNIGVIIATIFLYLIIILLGRYRKGGLFGCLEFN